MPPFVLTLLAQGLGLLGNAVLAKGKDVINEKLGVDVDALSQTPEGLQKLKQLEVDHEEFLVSSAIENRKIDLQDKALDIGNTEDARMANVKIQESINASWLAKNMAYCIDGVIILATLSLAALMFFHAIPTENKEIAYAAFGSLITMCGTILNFHRGTSSGSAKKDNTIDNLTKGA